MESRRLRFAYLGDVAVDFIEADPKTNRLFAALAMVHLAPNKLSIDLGRISEATATRLLAQVYAGSVVVGSPSPLLCDFRPRDWMRWLIEHPYELGWIRRFAEDPETFKPGAGRFVDVDLEQDQADFAALADDAPAVL